MPSHPEPNPEGSNRSAPKRSTAPTSTPQPKQEKGKKFANGIVARSSAAIIAVYAAGYLHTASAAASVANVAPTALVASVVAPPTATAPPTADTATTTVAPTATTPATAVAPLATATVAASSTYKDGTYTGSGTSKHGGVAVAVVIKNGVIVSSAITASNTRYPIARIAALPGEVVAAQSASIDFVSGATDSSMAFQTAVTSALASAKRA